MYPKHSIVPPGGFHFVEKYAGTEIRLIGDSVDNLAANLEKYRLTNGIPLANPKQEIVDYICGNWPHFCNETEHTGYLDASLSAMLTSASRVAAWVTRLWNIGADNFVTPKEADRRAAICQTCPMNQDFRAGGCSSCVQGTDRLAFLWLSNRAVTDHKQWHALKACRATGAHLQAGVFADRQPDMRDEEKLQLPAECWRKEAT